MSEPAEDDFDLIHWKEVCYAHEAELQWLRAENARLREALQHADAALDSLVSDEMPYTESCRIWRIATGCIRAALAGEVKP